MRIKNKLFVLIILLLVSILFFVNYGLADDSGCCTLTCKQANENDCPNFFELGKKCNEIEKCNIGCCVDEEGYCLANFLKANCERLNGRFISKKECRQHVHCLTEPYLLSLRGYTGFPFIFENEDSGMLSVIPISGEREDTFKIRQVVFEREGLDRVEAVINLTTTQSRVQLYNDGAHGDGNENDTIFANQWDSSIVSSFHGTKNIRVDINIYRNGRVNNSGSTYLTLIDNIKCLPIFKLWQDNASKKGIIFVGYNYDENTVKRELRKDAEAVIGALLPLNYFENELDELNFYIILKNMSEKDSRYIHNYIKAQCSLYNELEDYVVLFDKNQLMCKQHGKLIITNPTLYPDIEEVQSINDLGSLMDNFCVYMLTEEKVRQNTMLKYEAPKITVAKPLNNSVFNINNIETSFIITDSKNTYLDYEVYLDTDIEETRYLKGTATSGVWVAGNLGNLPDGWHELHVEALDSDGNLGFSDSIRFYINVSNFVINLTSPDSIAYNESPTIEFRISHATNQNINYSVFVNDNLFADGTTAINQVVSLPTDLAEGDYKIKINATDNESRSTWYMPAPFYIDKQKPQLEILTPGNSQTSEISFKATDNRDSYLMYRVYVGAEEKEESYVDVDLVESVQLTGLPNIVTITVADFAGNVNARSVFLRGATILSPPSSRYESTVLGILVIILTFLMAIAAILYHKK